MDSLMIAPRLNYRRAPFSNNLRHILGIHKDVQVQESLPTSVPLDTSRDYPANSLGYTASFCSETPKVPKLIQFTGCIRSSHVHYRAAVYSKSKVSPDFQPKPSMCSVPSVLHDDAVDFTTRSILCLSDALLCLMVTCSGKPSLSVVRSYLKVRRSQLLVISVAPGKSALISSPSRPSAPYLLSGLMTPWTSHLARSSVSLMLFSICNVHLL